MAPDFNRNVHCLLGLPFDVVDLDQAEQKLREAIRLRSRCFLSTPNLNFLIACQNDAAFRNSVIASDLVVADGMPVVWLAKLLGIPISHRVAGASLFERLREGSPKGQIKVFFFGGQDGIAEAACQRVNLEDRGVRCVGYLSPGFGSIESMSEPSIIEKINDSGADFLVVSLGAQKGQKWIMRNLERINIPVVSHLGAVVNFVAGTVKRAPKLLQVMGLEWLWRIREEPHLWRRYLIDAIGLLQLIFTKVLPLLWSRFGGHGPISVSTMDEKAQLKTENRSIRVTLSDAYNVDDPNSLKETLVQITASNPSQISINFRDVSFINSYFLGTMLMLNEHQRSNGGKLILEDVSNFVRRQIYNNGVEFLLLDVN